MRHEDINYSILMTFVAVHAVTAYALWSVGFEWKYLTWTLGLYCFRWLGFTCSVHRYFSHRVFRTSRWFQGLLGVWATLTMARSPIRFASGHRHHHIYSDTKRDLHSPKELGLGGAYLGWVISKRYHEDVLGRVSDLRRYPELVVLNKFYFVPNLLFLYLLYMVGGGVALTYGGLVSVIVIWHVAFSVTVIFHVYGRATYETYDRSRNSNLLGFLTFGEGWHNNHHANMSSARLGHEPWQVDLGFLFLSALEKAGLIWDLNRSVGARSYGASKKLRLSHQAAACVDFGYTEASVNSHAA